MGSLGLTEKKSTSVNFVCVVSYQDNIFVGKYASVCKRLELLYRSMCNHGNKKELTYSWRLLAQGMGSNEMPAAKRILTR